jgi:serine/threonine protein kinase
MRQACEGIAAAHAAGILQRHICPANILVTDGDLVKVVDLGSAKLRDNGILTTGELSVSVMLTAAPNT